MTYDKKQTTAPTPRRFREMFTPNQCDEKHMALAQAKRERRNAKHRRAITAHNPALFAPYGKAGGA